MKNKVVLFVTVAVVLALGYYVWNRYVRVDKVAENTNTVQEFKPTGTTVKKNTIASDIDKNISEMDKEIDSLDADKDLGDFKDLSW